MGGLLPSRSGREGRDAVHTADSAPEASRDALKQLEATCGKVLNILTELSAHVTLNLLMNYFNHHVHTELDVPQAPET